jgi:hypothetical protein
MSVNESITKILAIVSELQSDHKKLFHQQMINSEDNKKFLHQQKINSEVIETTYQITEDVCKKFDLVLNVGIKKPTVSTIKTEESKEANLDTKPKKKTRVEKSSKGGTEIIKNILTYFKVRYNENMNIFDSILEENQAKSIFEENAKSINAKKNDVEKQKERTNLLYKNLSDSQKKKVREMMTEENESAVINNDDDIETEN